MNISDIIHQTDSLITQIDQGETEALIHYIEIKNLISHLEASLKLIKNQAIEEANRYNGETYRGYEIQVREGGGRYSYDHLPQWRHLKDQLKEMEKVAQNAFKMYLKGDIYVSNDGEQIEPAQFKQNEPSILFKIKE